MMQEYERESVQQNVQENSSKTSTRYAGKPAAAAGIPNSVLNDVFAGKRRADSSMMGHSQNLAPSIAAKMSRAFGMDLTGMQVYQSDAMKDTGMRGMAQGNKIVLSSDVDLNTTAGQAVLGHEISHIHAQSQGTGMGHSGLYENAALEHQADTEGLLAAQGRSIYSDGMDTGIGMQYGLGMQGVEGLTSLSSGMSASAGAPMQAKKDDTMEVNTGLLKKPGKKMGLLDRMEKFRMSILQKRFGVSDEDLSKMKKRKKMTQFERIAKMFGGGQEETASTATPTTTSPVNTIFDEPTILPNKEDVVTNTEGSSPLIGENEIPKTVNEPLIDDDEELIGENEIPKTVNESLIDDDEELIGENEIPKTVNEPLIDDDEELIGENEIPKTVNEPLIDDEGPDGTTPFDDMDDEKRAKDEEVWKKIMDWKF